MLTVDQIKIVVEKAKILLQSLLALLA